MALEIFTIQAVSVLLLVCGVECVIGQQGSGVHFSLSGAVYFNNSVIPLTDIGTEGSTTPLVCNTDLRPCCFFRGENPVRVEGHWYYPNGTELSGNGNFDIRRNFFRTRGQFDGTVNIFRRSMDITSPFGRYRCDIPNAMMEVQTLWVNLAPTGFSFVINDGGATPTIGQSYSLSCSVTGGTVNSYQWRKDDAVLQGQTTEVLSFSPLRLSDAGWYSCEISVTASSETFTAVQNHSIIIQIPTPTSVTVTSNPASTIRPVGADVTLTCTVVLSSSVDVSVTVNTTLTGPGIAGSMNGIAQREGSTTNYVGTAMVSSFGRDQSGVYTCTATVTPTSQFFTSNSASGTARVTVGVYLSQNGMFLSNNSAVYISDIGESSNTRLQCITDRMPCCASEPSRAGEWFFPDNGGIVPSIHTTFYRNRGDDGTVNLNRVSRDMSPTGQYCCVIPDATDAMQWACAIIFAAEVSDGGVTPTIGQSYTLTCGTFGASGFTYQWSRTDSGVLRGQTDSEMLSFSSLRLSDGGRYTCVATLNSRPFTSSFDIVVQIPAPFVTVTTNPDTITTAGTCVDVICTVKFVPAVVGTNISLLMVDAKLSRNGTTLALTGPTMIGTRFTFSSQITSFDMSNVGDYICTATVSLHSAQTYITGNTTATGRATVDIAMETVNTGCCDVTRAVGLSVGLIIIVEVLIVLPVIAALWWRRKSSYQSCNGFGCERKEGISEGGVYEEPDKLTNSGQCNYELTQCPAYEATEQWSHIN